MNRAAEASDQSQDAFRGVNSRPVKGVAASELPCTRIGAIERLPEAERWLVDGLLSSASITVLASAPKAGKTWVALAVATAVASGTAALGRFLAQSSGSVLLFPAEDDPRAVRERIESLCQGQQLNVDELPIHVITAHSLRLDDLEDRTRLERLITRLRPKLLVLDPLVRLHSGAESYVGHIAELFGYLRELQRRFQVAVLVTHHLSKSRSSNAQPGSAMRGSGDIHAAYDHGVALERRKDGSVILSVEHRSAPSPDPLVFRLHSSADGGTSFEFLEADDDERLLNSPPKASSGGGGNRQDSPTLAERVLETLKRAASPLSQVSLRRALKVRNETLSAALRELEATGAVQNLGRMGGWRIAQGDVAASDNSHPR